MQLARGRAAAHVPGDEVLAGRITAATGFAERGTLIDVLAAIFAMTIT